MNAKQRKALNEIVKTIRTAQEALEEMAAEEEEKFENLSEGLQGGEKGQALEEAAQTLNDKAGELGDIADELDAL